MSGTKRKSSDLVGRSSEQKKMKMAANNDSMDKLFNNDLCIRSILAYLPIKDLANAARASYVLKINADIVFRTVHAATIKLKYDKENFMQQQMIFQQFGRLAKKVEIDMGIDHEHDEDIFNEDGNKVLRTIGHFCLANLHHLTLRCMQVNLSSAEFSLKDRLEVRTLLSKITKLELFTVCIENEFFIWTKSLKELTIHSCCHLETLPEPTSLPELKILNIGACPTWFFIVGDSFNDFLRMNPSIEEVNYHFIMVGFGHLQSICSLPRLTNLELILLECDDDDLSLIANARKLKKLKLHVSKKDQRQISKLQKLLPTGCELSVENIGHH